MRAVDWAVLNITEVRRRSQLVWRSAPDEWLKWKPDEAALSMGEMIRHMWTAQVYYHEALVHGGSVSDHREPCEGRPILSAQAEIELSTPHFERFVDYIQTLRDEELATRMIDRSNVGYIRSVGDMLARIPYHEAVHTGQLLQYMRMAGLQRPNIWD